MRTHPLRAIEDPSTWRNVPPCVTSAITAIFKHSMEGDGALYDFEMKTNERLLKLQTAITKNKEVSTEFMKESKQTLEARVKVAEARADARMKVFEQKISDLSEKVLSNQVHLKTATIGIQK